MARNQEEDLPVPGSDAPSEKVFDYAFLHDQPTVNYLNSHGHVMFIIRGPPGTGKESLGDMILSRYPSSKLLSAKNYFKQPLAESRTKNGTKLSHDWCYNKTEEACRIGQKVIVSRNTNVRKREIKRYLHLSQDYGYTTIIADASKKFQFDAEVLAKSNAQGLNSEYFKRRLCHWDEIVPWYTGWFLNPADNQWLENDIMKHLSVLLQSSEFRSDFRFPSTDADISEYYKNERELFCIAKLCSCNESGESHYLNKTVQSEMGKVSDLTLTGYLVTSELVLAIVNLSSKQEEIVREGKPEKSDRNDLGTAFQKLTIQYRREPLHTIAFSSIPSKETVRSEDRDVSALTITNLSYIVIKHRKNSTKSFPYIADIDTYSEEIFSRMKGKTPFSPGNFSFSDGDIKAFQLKQMVWLVCPLKKYTVQSVFTGLYS